MTARQSLALKVIEVLWLLAEDEYSRDEVLGRMVDAVDACSDKPLLALGQLRLIALAAAARGDRAALRLLAVGVARLGVVHEHARRKVRALEVEHGAASAVDEVSVVLKFEVELRAALELPVAYATMLFPRSVDLSDDELAAASAEALAVQDGTEAFEAWLSQWPEWQRQLRWELAQRLHWEALPRNDRRWSMSWQDLFGAPMEDPVRLRQSVVSLQDLVRHWVATGNDFNNVHISPQALERELTRCERRTSVQRIGVAVLRASLGRSVGKTPVAEDKLK